MFELHQLEQLVTIAKVGTLSKAAKELLISQPALTRSIQKLEEELQVQLFDRQKNKIMLNDNGKLAVKYASKILQDACNMTTSLQAYHNSKRTITIGSCAPAPVWGVAYLLRQQYPQMAIKDEVYDDNEALLQGLKKHQYSLIILNHPVQDKELLSIELFEENLFVSVPPAHPLALCQQITFEDLNGESVLLLSRIGFWNKVCLEKIPNSHLLIQEDVSIYNELTKASALPSFKTDITIQRDQTQENRVYIPIVDKEANAKYYAIFNKEDKQRFVLKKEDLLSIPWQNT